ncbi:hypothetical protein BUALT_Bualt16G0017000 [Buddleja alternifolia]|uniref:Uncharacterized protein n=1 Tax=Buddleja alternifolia TaxID=168488 RepID=A0AAV6WIW5_9LAMI|nr:hypothetical protein BUALT_Bualt16G0017000 [Buddleja alternifolia]
MDDDTADYNNPDEWELVNDDGFVHKRKKRPRLDPAAAAAPRPDPSAERKHRRERKKRALLKLRDRYLKEISRWELLSNTLKEMEHNAQTQPLERQEMCTPRSIHGESSSNEQLASNSTRRRVVDDLLFQVEAQEAIIRDVSNLCDVAEALCSAQEERLKQQFTDLPIWDPSPHELMAALGED